MILKVRLASGTEFRVPIQYAHIKDGCLLYQAFGAPHGGAVIELNQTLLVEFEPSEPNHRSS